MRPGDERAGRAEATETETENTGVLAIALIVAEAANAQDTLLRMLAQLGVLLVVVLVLGGGLMVLRRRLRSGAIEPTASMSKTLEDLRSSLTEEERAMLKRRMAQRAAEHRARAAGQDAAGGQPRPSRP